MSRLNQFLSGVRVLDLTGNLPGPLATLFLADMGAHVVKIEGPDGDGMVHLGPRDERGRPVYYTALAAGKEVLVLDLKQEEGRNRFLDLVADADVVVESFRPEVMPRLGLGSATLRARNPRLVYVSLSGYGRIGPKSAVAGHDANFAGLAGMLVGTGPRAAPTLVYPPLADCLGSMFGLSTILGALLARERDGKGCDIDLALADVVMPLQVLSLAELRVTGPPAREKGIFNGGWACYRLYETADGRHVALCAVEPQFWQRFCTAAGHPEWIRKQGEPTPQADLIGELSRFFRGMNLDACNARFGPADCCLTPVLDLDEAVHDDYHRVRGLVQPAAGLPGYESSYPVLIDGQPPRPRSSR